MFKELVKKSRSYRRFDSSIPIPYENLVDIVDIARLTPSAHNQQAMRFLITNTPTENEKVFSTLKWAGMFKDWHGPITVEQPTAYIILLRDKSLAKRVWYDDGIVAQTVALAAVEKGYGTCMLQNCAFNELFKLLNIDKDKYVFSLVIAIGVPVEEVVIEDVENNDVTYYRDEANVHHVPKRKLEDVLVNKEK